MLRANKLSPLQVRGGSNSVPPIPERKQENQSSRGSPGDRHRGKTCRAQQHTGNDHRFSAKAVGNGPAKDARALLDKLA